MQLSLIVRGQHPPGDIVGHFRDDIELVKRAEAVGFDGIVKGSHYSAHPFEYLQQIPFLGYCAAAAPKLRLICGLVLLPLHKPLDLADPFAASVSVRSGALELTTQWEGDASSQVSGGGETLIEASGPSARARLARR